MEMHLTPQIQAELEQFAADTGCAPDTLVNQLLSGYFEERSKVRETLSSRYDDMKSGRVQMIDGETVRREMLDRIKAYRTAPGK